MPLEIGRWRVDGDPKRMTTASMPLESRLEELIEADPGILGEAVHFIGRQVPTAHGKYIDLLGVDATGGFHVLDLKRDRTPRDVVAQALDYGSWVQGLTHDDVLEIFETYRPGVAFEEGFSERFGVSPPEELNGEHHLTVVASDVDPATARIVEYLADFDVPLNVLLPLLRGRRPGVPRSDLARRRRPAPRARARGRPAGRRSPGTATTGT